MGKFASGTLRYARSSLVMLFFGSGYFCAQFDPALAQSGLAPRVFDRIVVNGNDRFRDRDIIVTSGLETGIPLDENDLIAAYEALEATAEFDSVVIESQGATLVITVDETPGYSGGLTFGAGYDTDNGLFGAMGLALDDVGNSNLQIRSNLFFAKEAQTFFAVVRSEDFWSPGVRGGIRLNYGNYEYDNVTYDYRSGQIEPYLGFDIGAGAVGEVRLTVARRDITNVAATASPIIAAEAGARTSFGVGFSLSTGSEFMEAENGVLDGWLLRFDQDFTGLGGDTDLSTTKLTFAARKQLSPGGFAIRTNVELAAVVGTGGDRPRASERFALGGSSLRGFERGTVAPRDICAGCGAGGADQVTLLGGNYYAVARTDVLFPIFPDRPELETFAFFDVGTAWNVDTATAPAGVLDDDRNWRRSFGIGASFDTELGKFEAYVALKTEGETFDEDLKFGLTFRTQF